MNAEDIEKYSMGDVLEELAADFEEHLLICQVCRDSRRGERQVCVGCGKRGPATSAGVAGQATLAMATLANFGNRWGAVGPGGGGSFATAGERQS